MCGKFGGAVADVLDVEEERTWNVPGGVLGASIAAAARKIEAAVEDAQPRIVEMLLQPLGRAQRIGMGVSERHRLYSSQSGTGKPLARRKTGLNSLLW